MSRRGSTKASGRRKQTSGGRPTGAPHTPLEGDPNARDTAAVDIVDPAAAEDSTLLADHPLLATMPRCGDCGGPVRWMLPGELKDVDPEAYRDVAAGVSPDVLDRADVWLCPQCGAAGMQAGDDDGTWDEDLGAVDVDDRCTACGTEVEWYDPAHVATIDKDLYMQAKRAFGAADLLDGEAAICPGCGRITFFPSDDLDH